MDAAPQGPLTSPADFLRLAYRGGGDMRDGPRGIARARSI
jgi:hypothetical protein